jgi:hypothetical protein
MRNRVFFPQEVLDQWVSDNRADVKGEDLLLKGVGRRYRMIEAVRILREVSGTADPHELIGRVKTRAFLNELGAEILGNSMIMGDNAYDIVQGFVGSPVGNFADYRKGASTTAKSDEELLSSFVG